MVESGSNSFSTAFIFSEKRAGHPLGGGGLEGEEFVKKV